MTDPPPFHCNSNFLRCTRRLFLFAPHCLTAFVSRCKVPRLHRYHVRAKGPLHRVAARVRPPGGQPVTRAAKIDMSKLKTWYATEGLRCACGARRNGIRSEDAATGSREASGGGRLPPTEHCYGVFSGRPAGGLGGDLRSRRALVRTEGGPIRTGATRTLPELSDRASNRRPPRHLSPTCECGPRAGNE